mmetsp:Transcript_10156/g.46514  ORF Transcript_10156/g.46514 Transcript_10156/m.46514 type:complete len:218 (-) Transcript_10156:504-1157(-)
MTTYCWLPVAPQAQPLAERPPEDGVVIVALLFTRLRPAFLLLLLEQLILLNHRVVLSLFAHTFRRVVILQTELPLHLQYDLLDLVRRSLGGFGRTRALDLARGFIVVTVAVETHVPGEPLDVASPVHKHLARGFSLDSLDTLAAFADDGADAVRGAHDRDAHLLAVLAYHPVDDLQRLRDRVGVAHDHHPPRRVVVLVPDELLLAHDPRAGFHGHLL